MENGGPCQTYVYDRFGNRALLTGAACNYAPSWPGAAQVDTDSEAAVSALFSGNRWSGSTADAVGNFLQPKTNTYPTLTYDAEQRIVSATTGPTSTASYAYDADGRRVSRTVGSTTTYYLYDAQGRLAAESSGTAATSGRTYLTADHLGSTRLVTDATGAVGKRVDYLPFGSFLPAGVGVRTTALKYELTEDPTSPAQRFSGKERDSETNLDYFGARYFSGAQGRWTSPDMINLTGKRLLNLSNTLNKYVYAANNPLKYIDPDGQDIVFAYHEGNPGHICMAAYNEQNGDFAVRDFGPKETGQISTLFRTVPGADWAKKFATDLTNPDKLPQLSVLSIQTNPEEAQKVIDEIKSNDPVSTGYNLRTRNCTTVCREAVAEIMNLDSAIWRPEDLWNTL